MRTVCQERECGKTIIDGPEDTPSHGICDSCFPGVLRSGGLPEEEIEIAVKEIKEAENVKKINHT